MVVMYGEDIAGENIRTCLTTGPLGPVGRFYRMSVPDYANVT